MSNILDTTGIPLIKGQCYCCVDYDIDYDGEPIQRYGLLVVYCGINPTDGQPVFADADDLNAIDVTFDALVRQLTSPINLSDYGWGGLV